ncbi:hypothetical protein ACQW02_02530 [Humitalea sp. 24SJ18S-53]|uniref:hypothetical protein n=1 Tax=Humitalea sp. 24SJ18S-53 TaxID=3422307 RepID=UPI003D67A056
MSQIWTRSLLHALMMSGAAALAETPAVAGQPVADRPLAVWQDPTPAPEPNPLHEGFRAPSKSG